MLRDDLAAARKAWLNEAKSDPEERLRREQGDFLAATNHEGERFDFHSLRHTCGAWLAMAGEHPKVIQTLMRHSSITLTMDTYGHLFPGQEADAVDRLRDWMAGDRPEALQATGTDNRAILDEERPRRAAHMQRAGRETGQNGARRCEENSNAVAKRKSPKSLQIADLGDCLQDDATLFNSSGGGTRTPDTRIMIPLL